MEDREYRCPPVLVRLTPLSSFWFSQALMDCLFLSLSCIFRYILGLASFEFPALFPLFVISSFFFFIPCLPVSFLWISPSNIPFLFVVTCNLSFLFFFFYFPQPGFTIIKEILLQGLMCCNESYEKGYDVI